MTMSLTCTQALSSINVPVQDIAEKETLLNCLYPIFSKNLYGILPCATNIQLRCIWGRQHEQLTNRPEETGVIVRHLL